MVFTLESPDFADGDALPRRCGYEAANVNPRLAFDDVPADAASLALIVDDPDAEPVAGKIWDHWVVWNVPPETTEIPADWDPAADGASVGRTDYGENAYGGPNPPDGTHTYRFEAYALDTELSLPEETDADALRTAMEGHVLADDTLRGTYAP
jgi:hypothetical protein